MKTPTTKVLSIALKSLLCLSVFLIPIFFLPFTVNVLDFNKQALLVFLAILSFSLWMFEILFWGKISFNLTKFYIPLGIVLVIFSASTFFSLWQYGSFWGWPMPTSESLITVISFLAIAFLIINVFEKKEIFYPILSLMISGLVVSVFAMLQAFGVFILPFSAFKSVSFNTVGAISRLGIFASILMPLMTVFLIATKNKLLKIVFAVSVVVNIALLIMINSSISWWLLIAGSALIMFFIMQRGDFFNSRWLVLPMFFLAISLLFIIFKFQIVNNYSRQLEVFLSYKTSLGVAFDTIKDKPLLGSGLGTFTNDFLKYKKVDFNQDYFWNLRFDSSRAKMIDVLATTGILGILAFLSLIGYFFIHALKFLFKDVKENDKSLWALRAGIFSSIAVLVISYFLSSSNLTLDFIFFSLIACFIVLMPSDRKEFILKPSSMLTIGVTFAFTLVFIFSLGIGILEGKRYAAEVSYANGIKEWQAGDSDDAIRSFERAVSVNYPVDLYWRELSQAYYNKINIEAARNDISKEEISRRAQLLVSSSVNSAKTATDINPNDVSNWANRGSIYQNLIGIAQGVADWSNKSYEEAVKLEPINPYYPSQIGLSLLKEASTLTAEQEADKNAKLDQARALFDRAIELKPDYAPARFQLAMVYVNQRKDDEAIAELEKTKLIAPNDVGLAFQMGLIYYKNDDLNNAKAEFERAVSINPNYSNALYFLGLIYSEKGNNSAAIDLFEKVKSLNPDNEEVETVLYNLRNGKSALEGIATQGLPTVPIEEKPKSESK